MAMLNFDINGDCTGALNALGNTQAAVEKLSGTAASAYVEVLGGDSVLNTLGGIQSAAAGISAAPISLGVDSSGISEARSALSDLHSDASTFGAGGFAGMGAGSDAVRRLTTDLGAAQSALQTLGNAPSFDLGPRIGNGPAGIEQLSVTAGGSSAHYESAAAQMVAANERIGNSAAQMERQMAPVATLVRNTGGEIQGLSDELGVNGASGLSQALGGIAPQIESAFNPLYRDIGKSFVQGFTRGIPNEELDKIGRNFVEGMMGGGGAPPIDFNFGGGGGGGGGGFFGDDFFAKGGGFRPNLGAAESLMGPAMMGGMIGLASDAVTGAIGIGSVMEAVKHVPGLAYAANHAMVELSKGIRQTASEATAEGVPALHALGAALRPLGEEIGHIGASQMGNVLGDATQLAGTATQGLKNLEPAIGPSISGLANLLEGGIKGFTSPAAVQAMAGLGNTLSTPQSQKTTEEAVGGLVQLGSQTANLLAQVANLVAPAVGGGPHGGASGTNWWDEPAGKWLADNHPLGHHDFAYSDKDNYGGLPLPGEGGGVSWDQNSSLGRWATLGGAVASSLVGQSSYEDVSQRWAVATGQKAPPPNGIGLHHPDGDSGAPSLNSSGFPTGQQPGRFGWNIDAQGNWSAANAFPGGNQQERVAAMQQHAHADNIAARQHLDQIMSGPQVGPNAHLPVGPGQSAMAMSDQQIQRLNQTMNSASGGAQHFGQNTQSAAQQIQQMGTQAATATPQTQQLQSSLGQMQQPLQQLNQPLQQLQQNAGQAQQQMQQMSQPLMQQMQQMSQPLQQLQTQTSQALQPMQDMAQQCQDQMQQASNCVQTGGQQAGQRMPQQMAAGISDYTSAACNAAALLGDAAANCAGSALGAASPAKRFIELGEWSGQGAAIGFGNSTGLVTGAAGAMMSDALGAGLAGASLGIRGVASDAGLNVGDHWARSVITGADSVLKASEFTSAGFPDLGSDLAKAVLGQAGLLGVAGSGASVYNVSSGNQGQVTMTVPLPIQVHNNTVLDGQVIDQKVNTQVVNAVVQISDSVGRQRG